MSCSVAPRLPWLRFSFFVDSRICVCRRGSVCVCELPTKPAMAMRWRWRRCRRQLLSRVVCLFAFVLAAPYCRWGWLCCCCCCCCCCHHLPLPLPVTWLCFLAGPPTTTTKITNKNYSRATQGTLSVAELLTEQPAPTPLVVLRSALDPFSPSLRQSPSAEAAIPFAFSRAIFNLNLQLFIATDTQIHTYMSVLDVCV